MIDKQGIAAAADVQKMASNDMESRVKREIAAASMAEKLGGLQETASRHGFDFLCYMLDIARAEAESLHHDGPQHEGPKRDCENSIASD